MHLDIRRLHKGGCELGGSNLLDKDAYTIAVPFSGAKTVAQGRFRLFFKNVGRGDIQILTLPSGQIALLKPKEGFFFDTASSKEQLAVKAVGKAVGSLQVVPIEGGYI